MRNLLLYSNGQIYSGDFSKFCGLLRIYELYLSFCTACINLIFQEYVVICAFWKSFTFRMFCKQISNYEHLSFVRSKLLFFQDRNFPCIMIVSKCIFFRLDYFNYSQRDEWKWELFFTLSAFVLASQAVEGCCRT